MSPELLDSVLLRTDFPELQLHASGKVRDVYQVDDESLLFVATDRISAFDYILATGIPHKGRVLTPPDPGGLVSVSVPFTAVHHCPQLTAPAASVQVADGDEPP